MPLSRIWCSRVVRVWWAENTRRWFLHRAVFVIKEKFLEVLLFYTALIVVSPKNFAIMRSESLEKQSAHYLNSRTAPLRSPACTIVPPPSPHSLIAKWLSIFRCGIFGYQVRCYVLFIGWGQTLKYSMLTKLPAHKSRHYFWSMIYPRTITVTDFLDFWRFIFRGVTFAEPLPPSLFFWRLTCVCRW